MEQYASKEDTIKALLEIGLVQVESKPDYYLSPTSFLNPASQMYTPVVMCRVYQCHEKWYCVQVGLNGWRAPVIWNGPKADSDKTNPIEEFVSYLNMYYPGWR